MASVGVLATAAAMEEYSRPGILGKAEGEDAHRAQTLGEAIVVQVSLYRP